MFSIFTYSFVLPYVIIWMLVMSNEIRYLYPVYLIIVMLGYKNILEFVLNLKDTRFINIKFFIFFVVYIEIS